MASSRGKGVSGLLLLLSIYCLVPAVSACHESFPHAEAKVDKVALTTSQGYAKFECKSGRVTRENLLGTEGFGDCSSRASPVAGVILTALKTEYFSHIADWAVNFFPHGADSLVKCTAEGPSIEHLSIPHDDVSRFVQNALIKARLGEEKPRDNKSTKWRLIRGNAAMQTEGHAAVRNGKVNAICTGDHSFEFVPILRVEPDGSVLFDVVSYAWEESE